MKDERCKPRGKNCANCSSFADCKGKPEGLVIELVDCLFRILDFCAAKGIDVEKAIRLKQEYNKTRPYRHGGKVI